MTRPVSIDSVPMDYFLKGVEAAKQPQAPAQAPQAGNAARPQAEAPKQAPDAGSLAGRLDVLLLQAAKASSGTIGEKTMGSVGKKLRSAALLSKAEATMLSACAEKASRTFTALDKFTGKDLGNAFRVEGGRTSWNPASKAAQACQAAIDAQNDLSEILAKVGRRVARAENAPEGMDGLLVEIRQICDRRATEIQSLAFRMHDFALYAAERGEAADPNVKAILDATAAELLPRQALSMHGTADVLAGKGGAREFAKSLKPLAARIDAFAENPGAGIAGAELESIRSDIARMRTAVKDLRERGIETGNGRMMVAKDILRALEAALDNAEKAFGRAKATVANAVRRDMLATTEKLLDLGSERIDEVAAIYPGGVDMLQLCEDFRGDLEDYVAAAAEDPRSPRTAELFGKAKATATRLHRAAWKIPERTAKEVGDDFYRLRSRARGAYTVLAEFKELARRMDGLETEKVFTGTEALSVFTGKVSVSNAVEARVRGLRNADVDPATDPGRLVSERKLGAGGAGEVHELRFAGGETYVFKGETEGRGGLATLQVGIGTAYADSQQAVQLNLASKAVADRLGCGGRIVKYSVGSHKGVFGMFMEKAKGQSARTYRKNPSKAPPGGLSAEQVRALPEADRKRIHGEIRRQLNQLQWLDCITGQLDRHHDNYFVFVDAETREVTVQGIDNDASFTTVATGMGKFELDPERAAAFRSKLGNLALQMAPDRFDEQKAALLADPGLEVRPDGSIAVDAEKLRSPALVACLKHATGMQTGRAPAIIDREMYNGLMALRDDPAKKQAFLEDLRDRLSPEAFAAQEKRLDDAIAHAGKLAEDGLVVDREMWEEINDGTRPQGQVKTNNVSGKRTKLGGEDSDRVLLVMAPTLFNRDRLAEIF